MDANRVESHWEMGVKPRSVEKQDLLTDLVSFCYKVQNYILKSDLGHNFKNGTEIIIWYSFIATLNNECD